MKKLLLTLATVAMCGFASYAAETTLEVKDATDNKGTDVPQKPAEATSTAQPRHNQPHESLNRGD